MQQRTEFQLIKPKDLHSDPEGWIQIKILKRRQLWSWTVKVAVRIKCFWYDYALGAVTHNSLLICCTHSVCLTVRHLPPIFWKRENHETFSLSVTRNLCYRKDDRAHYISGSNEPLRRYGHSKLSKMAAGRQLGFDVTGNSAIQSADPENLL